MVILGIFSRLKSLFGGSSSGTADQDHSASTDVHVERERSADHSSSTAEPSSEPPSAEEALGETEAPSEGASVETVSGIGPAYARRLMDADIVSVSDLVSADPAELAAETELSEKRIRGWQDAAN